MLKQTEYMYSVNFTSGVGINALLIWWMAEAADKTMKDAKETNIDKLVAFVKVGEFSKKNVTGV